MSADGAQFNAADFANKGNLLRVVNQEADRLLSYAEKPENWEAATACGDWQVRDIAGHMVDVTEGYLKAFSAIRNGEESPEPLGLGVMAERLDQNARAFRNTVPHSELLRRLKDARGDVMGIFEGLKEDEWTNLMVAHTYMGPLPAFIYPVFQLIDYGIHGWDIREGLELNSGLPADTADFLVPFAFVVWQSTTDPQRAAEFDRTIGVRVSGRNGGSWRVTVNQDGYAYEQGSVGDLPTVFDFDPAGLVLTAFGRIRGGTAYGDTGLAQQYRNLFFSI